MATCVRRNCIAGSQVAVTRNVRGPCQRRRRDPKRNRAADTGDVGLVDAAIADRRAEQYLLCRRCRIRRYRKRLARTATATTATVRTDYCARVLERKQQHTGKRHPKQTRRKFHGASPVAYRNSRRCTPADAQRQYDTAPKSSPALFLRIALHYFVDSNPVRQWTSSASAAHARIT